MTLPWTMRGLFDGVVTTRWPRRADEYFDGFRAAVEVRTDAPPIEDNDMDDVESVCPSGALAVGGAPNTSRPVVDRGRCIMCGRCVARLPQYFEWKLGADVASLSRGGLAAAGPAEADLAQLRAQLRRRVVAFGRSVHIRHVDTGSDGSVESEVRALLNPIYDIHRLGVFITPSPRHADILMVTGVGAAEMQAPLARARAAMPDPVVVMAVGSDACGGGLLGDGYHSAGGIQDLLRVDVWVPGAPPSPFSILHGILVALGRFASVDEASTKAGDAP